MPLSTPRTDRLLLEIGEKSSLVRLDLWDATLAPISLTFGIRAIQPGPFRHARPPRSSWSAPSWWWRMS